MIFFEPVFVMNPKNESRPFLPLKVPPQTPGFLGVLERCLRVFERSGVSISPKVQKLDDFFADWLSMRVYRHLYGFSTLKNPEKCNNCFLSPSTPTNG